MIETIETVNPEAAARFQDVVMRTLAAYLTKHGPQNVGSHEVFNGTINALCLLLKQIPDKPRTLIAAQCVRLLLDEAGCSSAEVLAEVENIRPLARFIESQAMGRA